MSDEEFINDDDNRPLLLEDYASRQQKPYQGKKNSLLDHKKSNIKAGVNAVSISFLVVMGLSILAILSFSAIAIFFLVRGQTVDPSSRVDCYPDPGASQQACTSRGCTWTPDNDDQTHTVPWCYFPTNTGYLQASAPSTAGGITTIKLQKSSNSVGNPFNPDFSNLNFAYQEIGAGLRVTISPDGTNRYRPLVDINSTPNIISTEKLQVNFQNDSIFSFKITRQSSGANIWDTSIGGLLFGDKYIQIATYLPTDKIYGFGEQVHLTIKHDFSKYRTLGMFARDNPPDSSTDNGENLYGVHPFYLGLEQDGKAHGVLIFNSNAQEVTLGPAPHLVYRTIGGQLEFYYLPGPTPEEVIKQYEQIIGTPFLPAYWALGFQLCRYGYADLADMQAAINRTISSGIPLDVAYADIDYMSRYKDFTYDTDKWSGLPQYVTDLHNQDMHVILIFDPAIEVDYDSFSRGLAAGAQFISWPREDLVPTSIQNMYPMAANTTIMLGVVWPDKHVAFPDFLEPSGKTLAWWINEFTMFYQKVAIDGMWIDMNEPSNFGTNQDDPWYFNDPDHPKDTPLKCPVNGTDSALDIPPYQTVNVYQWGDGSYLCSNTLCMLAVTNNKQNNFYDTKSLYGWSEAKATYAALKTMTGKRGAVIGRSTFPSSGRYAGHWLGDNTARWEDLRTSIIGAQEFNMFGIPYVGSDVCGFNGNSNEELCLRWQQMGAFHSFFRNHNTKGDPPQDPGQWPSVAAAARKSNLFRYRHLPYLFSLHFSASLNGGTVVRPVFFEFWDDSDTYNLSYEFMWGSGILAMPVTNAGDTTVNGYLPIGSKWYSVYDYFYGTAMSNGKFAYPAPTNYLIPTFVRAGYIIPRQHPDVTTVTTRKNVFELLVALANATDSNTFVANGELYWDDGETIVDDFNSYNYHHLLYSFTVNKASATLNITKDKIATGIAFPSLDNLEVFGYPYQPNLKSATLNGNPLTINTGTSSYSTFTQVLNITTTNLIDLNTNDKTLVISWPNLATENFWKKLKKESENY